MGWSTRKRKKGCFGGGGFWERVFGNGGVCGQWFFFPGTSGILFFYTRIFLRDFVHHLKFFLIQYKNPIISRGEPDMSYLFPTRKNNHEWYAVL